MEVLPTAALSLVFCAGCGYFQYWMAARLECKRWLLWLQPGLLLLIAACFTAWLAGVDRLPGSTARPAALPFWVALAAALAGTALGDRRRKRKG